MNTITKKEDNNSTIEKTFDKHGNKAPMCDNVREVDEETIIKEDVKWLTSNNITLLQSDNIEDIAEINNSVIIEAGVTKKRIRKLKNYYVYLLNYARYIFQENILENVLGNYKIWMKTLRKFCC